MNLLELGVKHKTDKVEHKYLGHYESRWGHLRHEEITLLEIGTWKGASLRMWREYFDKARIVGFDVIPEWSPAPEDDITLLVGDQADEKDLSYAAALGPYDIVVDDGGHQGTQHVASFEALWPCVKPGGWWAIEDCQSLFNVCWTQPGDRTMLTVIHELEEKILTGQSLIAEVHLIGDNIHDGLIMLRKRT